MSGVKLSVRALSLSSEDQLIMPYRQFFVSFFEGWNSPSFFYFSIFDLVKFRVIASVSICLTFSRSLQYHYHWQLLSLCPCASSKIPVSLFQRQMFQLIELCAATFNTFFTELPRCVRISATPSKCTWRRDGNGVTSRLTLRHVKWSSDKSKVTWVFIAFLQKFKID